MQDTIYTLLEKQLHTLTVPQLLDLKNLAAMVFEPLVRPFRQHRVVRKFSFQKSLRERMRVGHLLPAYEREIREHRKSKLRIALSLSGVDRCTAVSLVPLLAALKQNHLDFHCYIYTDDLIEAEFTPDGFLANDWKLAWNNVVAPVVFSRLLEIPTQSDEILLIIDSFGGGDSQWYNTWYSSQNDEIRKEQEKYLQVGGRYGFYTRMRQELQGRFENFSRIRKTAEWEKVVETNSTKRWMETPALEQYMIRWVFHPQFGNYQHGNGSYISSNLQYVLPELKKKYKEIHWLTPNCQEGTSKVHRDSVLSWNCVTYLHEANTIDGFASVLSNIVHGNVLFDGPYTKKVAREDVIFGVYHEEDDQTGDEPGDHTELVEGTDECFAKCTKVTASNLPKQTKITYPALVNGRQSYESVPFNEVDVETFLTTSSVNWFWRMVLPSKVAIEPGDSEYTQISKAQKVLDEISSYRIVFDQYSWNENGLKKEYRGQWDQTNLQSVLKNIQVEEHHTRVLVPFVEQLLRFCDRSYDQYMLDAPLRNMVWCTVGQFNFEKMSLACRPNIDNPEKKRVVWHEFLHYLEHVCPAIGMWTSAILRRKAQINTGPKLIELAKGELAAPVADGSVPWIKQYAGKWYKRHHKDLPNPTEVLTVHGEYFTSPEALVPLIKHDLHMVALMAFIFMGGPVASLGAYNHFRKKQVDSQIEQKGRVSKGFKIRSTGGGSGSKTRGSSEKSPRPNKDKRFGL